MEMKNNRVLIIITSIYLLLCSFGGVLFFFTALIQNDLSILLNWVPILICGTLISLSVFFNYKILFNKNIKKEWVVANFWLCIVQAPQISLNGLQLKYNQGFELIGYLNVENVSKNVTWGIYYTNINLNLVIKFLDLNYSFIGLNIIMFILSVFYWIQYNRIVSSGSKV